MRIQKRKNEIETWQAQFNGSWNITPTPTFSATTQGGAGGKNYADTPENNDGDTMNDDTRYCKYEKCAKAISRYSRHGRLTALHRYAKQTFCSDACARIHYFAEEHKKAAILSKNNDLVNNWLYGRIKGQIS
jgi:hypothetical protein